jgi:hypothetical protein
MRIIYSTGKYCINLQRYEPKVNLILTNIGCQLVKKQKNHHVIHKYTERGNMFSISFQK